MSHALAMTDLLERAMVAARDLPPEMQGELTCLVLAYAGDGPPAIPPSRDATTQDARRMPPAEAQNDG